MCGTVKRWLTILICPVTRGTTGQGGATQGRGVLKGSWAASLLVGLSRTQCMQGLVHLLEGKGGKVPLSRGYTRMSFGC